MLQIKKLLFPIDFSDRCLGAASYVEAFAGRFQSELTLLHVVSRERFLIGGGEMGTPVFDMQRDRVESARNQMRTCLNDELKHFDVKRLVVEGDPAHEVIEFVRKENVDLIMIPSRGFGLFRRYVIGSTTAKVLHDAPCPVWTSAHVENAPPLETIAFHKVVCAVDFGAESEITLDWAAGFAEEHGAELIVLHAVPVWEGRPAQAFGTDFTQVLLSDARERAGALVARVGCSARVIVGTGAPAAVVKAVGADEQADLVVIARGSAAEGFGRLRTHAYAIIRDSPCPVVSV